MRGLVDTGPIGHEFAMVGTMLQQMTGIATVNGTPYATNIYNPNIIAPPGDSRPEPPTRPAR